MMFKRDLEVKRSKSERKGVALLVVLGIVMIVTILSLGYVSRTDVELTYGKNMLIRTQMDYLADSAIEHARELILNPKDIDTGGLGYWTSAVRQQLVPGDDYYDVSVVRDDAASTLQWIHYLIECSAYREKGGERVGQRELSAVLRVKRIISALLMVVVDPDNLSGTEETREDLIESWGWNVTLISAAASQADFNVEVAASSVAYVSMEISDSDLGTKLRNAGIGIVNENLGLVDDFGFSTSWWSAKVNKIKIIDNTHYITDGLSPGDLIIFDSRQVVGYLDLQPAPDLHILAIFGNIWKKALATLEPGDTLADGGTAAGRRVQLPWGGDGFNFDSVIDNGQNLMKRAIEWAAR